MEADAKDIFCLQTELLVKEIKKATHLATDV